MFAHEMQYAIWVLLRKLLSVKHDAVERLAAQVFQQRAPPRWLPRVANVTLHLRNPGSRSRAAEVSDGVFAASNPAHEAIHEGFRASGSEARSGTHVLLCVRGVALLPIGREPKSLWPPIGQGLVSTDS